MSVLNLMAKLGLDSSGFVQGLSTSKGAARAFGSELEGYFAGKMGAMMGLGAIEELVRRTVLWGHEIEETSRSFGISIQAVQEFDYAATKAGKTVDAFSSFFRSLAKSRAEALGGDKKKMGMFGMFGMDETMMRNMRLEDMAKMISDVMKMGDPQKYMASLTGIGGRGVTDILPMMVDGLSDTADEANKLHLILKDDIIKDLADMVAEFRKLYPEVRSLVAGPITMLWEKLKGIPTLLKLGGLYSTFTGAILGGATMSEAMGQVKKEGNKILDDFENTMKPRADKGALPTEPDQTGLGYKPWEHPRMSNFTVHRFNLNKPERDASSLPVDSLTRVGALYGGMNQQWQSSMLDYTRRIADNTSDKGGGELFPS
jgi:hypothetical protein